MLTLKQTLAKNYINARGWRTKRKLLLIESDDWGAIRMPSRQTYDYLLSKNIAVDQSYFDKNDSLESAEDMECLYEVLDCFRDIHGNPAVVTAFSVVANPDFEKIEASKRQEYHYELITETYKRNPHTEKSFSMFQEGIGKRMLIPQFHGREHLNTIRYLEAINSKSLKENIAFDNHSFIGAKLANDIYNYPYGYMAAFNWLNVNEAELQKEIIADGLQLFRQLFGFSAISFVPSQAIAGNEIKTALKENGVQLIIGQQLNPQGDNKTKIIDKIWGRKNDLDQIYWRRNCTFEPSRNQNYDWVRRTLEEIEIAFRWGKPAVINSHRVNYIGSIFPENRKQSLAKLKILLCEVQKRWPDVEFIDTERLAHIMQETIK